ncbi:hypothetical protein MRX96_059639 [Rhipicephalus microplus]
MLYAICMKMFLITFDFIDNMVAFYTCMQDGVALFLIYDFYEGVKQQGTLLASGLVDSLPEREIGSSPKQVVPIDEHGEAVGDALLEESPENHALPSGDTIDSRTTDKSMNPA